MTWWAELADAEDRANAFATKEMHTERRLKETMATDRIALISLHAQANISEAMLETAIQALKECQEEIDQYVRNEYPGDHPVHEQYRKRDFAANPARIALDTLTTERTKHERTD